MEKINILLLLTPKNELALLDDTMSLRQALEKMKVHGYNAVPVINKKTGEYIGSISDADLLWTIDNDKDFDISYRKKITDILRKDYQPAEKVDADTYDIINMITNRNYVPIVDDRNVLMGIVTRRKVIYQLLNLKENLQK